MVDALTLIHPTKIPYATTPIVGWISGSASTNNRPTLWKYWDKTHSRIHGASFRTNYEICISTSVKLVRSAPLPTIHSPEIPTGS